MKKGKLIFLLILSILVYFPSISSNSLDKIKLNTSINSSYTIYETKLALIYLNNSDILKTLESQIQSSDLCVKKKVSYSEILKYYLSHKLEINYIIIPTKDASLEKDLPTQRKTGFAPLDFFTSLVWLDLSESYVPPYGYRPTFLDSISYNKIDTLNKSIVNELLLKGKGRVLNKSTLSFEKGIYLEVLDFNDGHGGRNFLFSNKQMFYNLDWFGDVGGIQDPECQ
jgi:hypothetical protein